jgi:hypothetical protein
MKKYLLILMLALSSGVQAMSAIELVDEKLESEIYGQMVVTKALCQVVSPVECEQAIKESGTTLVKLSNDLGVSTDVLQYKILIMIERLK